MLRKFFIIPKIYNNKDDDDESYKFPCMKNPITEERSNIIPGKP